jgi:hypothetical protein
LVGKERIDDITTPIAVAPGDVVVALVTPSGRRHVTATVEPGADVTVELEVPSAERDAPAPSADTGKKPGARSYVIPAPAIYAALGVGVAGLVAFGVFGGLSVDAFSELERSCPNNFCPEDKRADIDEGKRFQIAANVGLGVGVVSFAAALTLFLVGEYAPQSTSVRPSLDGTSIVVPF